MASAASPRSGRRFAAAKWAGPFPCVLLGNAAVISLLAQACRLPLRAAAYTVEELVKADHSVAMKLAVEEDNLDVLHGVVSEFKGRRKVPVKDLCGSHSNIFHYADYTPIHYACLLDRTDHIEVLLAAGCSPELATDSGLTPLQASAREGSVLSARTLLRAGADPARTAVEVSVHNNDVPQRGFGYMNAATLAAQAGHVGVLRAILDSGTPRARQALQERDLNGLRSPDGWAPLHYAASKGQAQAAMFLVFEVGWGDVDKNSIFEAADAGTALQQTLRRLASMSDEEFAKAKAEYLVNLGEPDAPPDAEL